MSEKPTYTELKQRLQKAEKALSELKYTGINGNENVIKLNSLINSVPDTIIQSDQSGNITYINHLFPGLSQEQVMNSTVFDFVPPEQRPVIKKALQTAFEQSKTSTYETLGPGPDGEMRAYDVNVSPILVGDEVVSAIFMARDISDRKQMEETLAKSEANLSSLINNRNESIWSIDRNYNFLTFNNFFKEAYWTTFKVKLEKGLNALDILSPELKEFWEPHYKKVLAGEQIDFEISNPVGDVLRYHSVSLNPIISDDQISGVSALSIDITEQRQIKQNILEHSASMLAIMENTPDSIWTINGAYEIVYVNSVFRDAFFTSFGVELNPGIALLEALPEPLRPMWKERYDRTLSGERFELVDAIDMGNHKIYIEVSFNPIRINDVVVGASFFGRDVSERKQVEQDRLTFEKQLLQTQKLESLGVLAGGIAHDFNNILMGIMGYTDLALAELNPIAPAREYVQGINDSTRKAAGLVKQMLAYSGKGKFSLEPIDLNHLINDTVQMLKISTSKNAVMKFNYSDNSVFLEGDPSQIRQIIMNLVINASDAVGKKSGVIAVTTGSMYCDHEYIESTGFATQIVHTAQIDEGMYTFMEISDTGAGMSKEIIARIFEPFFTTKFTGRGLGLSAVLGIVGGHNGMIKIYSEEGKGTTFKVLFPMVNTTEKPQTLNTVGSIDKDWQGEGSFLIADDEEAVRTVGKHMIKKLGYNVLTAEDGREAIKVFKEHKADIVGVLLDLTMPHKDGAEVFREIQKLAPDVKVILTSGYNEQDATQQFVGKGLAGFVQKPYATAELVKKIMEIMGDK